MIIIRIQKARFFSSDVLTDLGLYKFLLLLISFVMFISCSENDVSTTQLAPTSTPLLASTPIPASTPMPASTPIPVSTPLPDIKQVPTVEPLVEVKEEPKDDDFQEGITFKRNIPTPIPTPKTYEEIMMANEELQKKFAEGEHLNAISRGMSIANCSILSPYFICKSERAESTGPESTDTPIMTYEELQKKWSEERLRAKQRELLVKETFNSLDNPRRTSQYLGWGKFYDVESLRIFATERVTDEFMLRVVATYTLMFSKNDLIDDDLQNIFFQTIRDERVFQKILYLGKDNDYDETSNALTSRYPGGGYLHNYSGHLVDHGHQDSHRREIIGQSLRTIIFTLRLMSDDFDHKDPNSALSKAYQEAVDKNLFAFTPDRPEPAELFYDEAIIKFLTNVITTEWGNRHLYKIYADEKFNIKDKNELINKLPLSHKLYEEFIEKIINPIDHVLFEKINEYNFESKVY